MQVVERASTLWATGDRWDAILAALRAEGFSKVDSIRATVELLRLPLARGEAHRPQQWHLVRRPRTR